MRLSLVLLATALALATACGARSELRVERRDPLVCPRGAFATFPGAPVDLSVDGPSWAAGRLRWAVRAEPVGASPVLEPGTGFTARFTSETEGAYLVRVDRPESEGGAAFHDGGTDAGNDGFGCDIYVNVRARGPQVVCPADVSVRPRETAQLNASATADRGIASRQWTLESAPAASARPAPSPTDQLSTAYTPDVAGDYVLRLTVRDPTGEEGRCDVTVHAVPTEALRVELFWNPPANGCDDNPHPGCDPTDVDLHLLHASQGTWFEQSADCYYANCARGSVLEWDAPGDSDNPHLDIDDVTGFGPENINVGRAGSGSYRIGVHFFDGHGRSDAEAHVVVYCGASATPVATIPPVTLHERSGGGPDNNDFWIVADVVMHSVGCEVRPIDRSGAAWVISGAAARSTAGPPPPGP
jgi:hypothetical protein